MTFTIGVPQIILLVILAYDFFEAIAKDGQPKERLYSGGYTAGAITAVLLLLWWGGFFGGCR